MAEESTTAWLSKLDPRTDALYVTMDEDTMDVKDLVVSSRAKRGTFIRSNEAWFRVPDNDEETLNDVAIQTVSPDIVDVFDDNEKNEKTMSFEEAQKFFVEMPEEKAAPEGVAPVTAAAEDKCPPATQDIALNLKNRENAIKTALYGPLNPAEPNEEFWQVKATRWSVTIEEAKKSLCANCAVFVTTSKMKDCIASGLEQGDSGSQNAWDAIDAAELGYCEAFDFKCAASRTCDAWVAGGPITDNVQ